MSLPSTYFDLLAGLRPTLMAALEKDVVALSGVGALRTATSRNDDRTSLHELIACERNRLWDTIGKRGGLSGVECRAAYGSDPALQHREITFLTTIELEYRAALNFLLS